MSFYHYAKYKLSFQRISIKYLLIDDNISVVLNFSLFLHMIRIFPKILKIIYSLKFIEMAICAI